VYDASGKDGTPPLKSLATGAGVTGVDWSGPIPDRALAQVKPAPNPQTLVDALLDATKLPAAADSSAARPFTKVYLWAYDSSRPSPIAAITDATADVLQKYPPLAASVNFHHWTPGGPWPLVGGCIRYRVVITGSIPPTASTFGLDASTPCSGASPTASPS
jgi:hypothetical protein